MRNRKKKTANHSLDLELETTSGSNEKDIPKFSPGQVIKGRLKVENVDKKRIKRGIIQLYGVEYPRWGRTRTISENIKEEVEYNENSKDNVLDLDIQVPQNAKTSLYANILSSIGSSKPRSILTILLTFVLTE